MGKISKLRKNNKNGQFKSGLHYARIGTGKKIIFLCLGGPGNDIPKGKKLKSYKRRLKPILRQYTFFLLRRKFHLPQGYSMENMADDYAKVIQEEFDGKIYGIMGISYGGMILHHFAGKYEDLVQKIIIISAAYKISQSGANYDKKFVENQVKRNTQKISLFSKKHDDIHYEEDILIEAEAELNYDPLDNIKNITKEILIICGDSDFYFPIENFRETHELIPTSTLIINHGKGHGAFLDKKGIQRIQQWLN